MIIENKGVRSQEGMKMKTYSDIQTVDCVLTHDNTGDLHDLCPPIDLRNEIVNTLIPEKEAWELWLAGAYNEESIYVLWLPEAKRAGVAWGSDAQWTDADSVTDALERFFGEDEKAMVN